MSHRDRPYVGWNAHQQRETEVECLGRLYDHDLGNMQWCESIVTLTDKGDGQWIFQPAECPHCHTNYATHDTMREAMIEMAESQIAYYDENGPEPDLNGYSAAEQAESQAWIQGHLK